MKLVIACLILCSSAYSQTVHVKHDNIIYKEKIGTNKITSSEVLVKAASALKNILNEDAAIALSDTVVTSKATIKLQTPYSLIRTLQYTIRVQPDTDGYRYQIDNIFLTEKPRGEKSKTIPGKILLKGLGESGKVSIETEKVLNEIDMRLQEVIARLKQEIVAG